MSEDFNIAITDAAVKHIRKMFKEQDIGFRLTIKKTGCSGLAYVPSVIDKPLENDICIESQGLKIFIDPNCQTYINGILIDYAEDKTGLKQKRLVFINPNEKNRCGCGESFTI